MKYNPEHIGKIIKIERTKRKWSQGTLGKKLGLSDKQISKYESDKEPFTIPPIDTMLRICEVFDCELGYLLGEKEYEAGTKAETIASDYTGLTQEALLAIRKITGKSNRHSIFFEDETKASTDILNRLLVAPEFHGVILQLVELDDVITIRNAIDSKLIEDIGQEAFEEAYYLETAPDSPLYVDYENEGEAGPHLSESQINAYQKFDKSINDKIDCGFRAKVLRYELHERMENLIEVLYPRIYEERNSI